MAGVLISILVIINKIIYPDIPMGWSSTLCVMVVFFGLVLMVLSIIGEYLGKIILILNNTPQYIVRETINTEGGAPAVVIKELIRAGREACPDSESKRNTGSAISNTDSEAKGNTDCGIKSNTDSAAKSKTDRGADV